LAAPLTSSAGDYGDPSAIYARIYAILCDTLQVTRPMTLIAGGAYYVFADSPP
jgi:hypothetical protein